MAVGRSIFTRILGRLRERRDRPAPRLAAPHARSGEPGPAPIFVIGCQRSGTSLLRRIIDSHSRIACPPESKFVLPLVQVLRDRSALRGLSSMGYDRPEVAASLAGYIDGLFSAYARARGKPRWADKTPSYVDCLPELWELFGPGATFVIIIRHGLDVAYSMADPHRHYPAIDDHVAREGGNVPVAAGRFWAEQNAKIEAFRGDHPAECFRLRYEDLTEQPEATLVPMFEFLGEPWEPGVLAYDRIRHDAGLEDPDVLRRRRIEPNSGRFARWPEDVQRSVREACEPVLSALGYA